MKRQTAIFVAAAAAVLITLGCSARRSEPNRAPIALDAAETRGQRVFMRFCHQCHPHGEGGVGPSLNDKPLASAMIKSEVRRGGGAMPPFDEQRISDDQLNDVTDYMAKVRLH